MTLDSLGATGAGLAALGFSCVRLCSVSSCKCFEDLSPKTFDAGLAGGLFFCLDFSSPSCGAVLSQISGADATLSLALSTAGGLGGGGLVFPLDFSSKALILSCVSEVPSTFSLAGSIEGGLGAGTLVLTFPPKSSVLACVSGVESTFSPTGSTMGGLGGGGLFLEPFLVMVVDSSSGDSDSFSFFESFNASLSLTPGILTGLGGLDNFSCTFSVTCSS